MQSHTNTGARLQEVCIHGRAIDADGKELFYIVRGRYLKIHNDETYMIAVEATNLSKRGTYLAIFSLDEYMTYLQDTSFRAPTSQSATLEYLQEFRGQQPTQWQANEREGKATVTVGPISSKYDIEYNLAPQSAPLTGNLPDKDAHLVRTRIMGAFYERQKATEAHLRNCERQHEAFAAAVYATLDKSDTEKNKTCVKSIRKMLTQVAGAQMSGQSTKSLSSGVPAAAASALPGGSITGGVGATRKPQETQHTVEGPASVVAGVSPSGTPTHPSQQERQQHGGARALQPKVVVGRGRGLGRGRGRGMGIKRVKTG